MHREAREREREREREKLPMRKTGGPIALIFAKNNSRARL